MAAGGGNATGRRAFRRAVCRPCLPMPDHRPEAPETRPPGRWRRARKSTASREPGNSAGAAGLLLVVLGTAGYLIERPPGLLDMGENLGWGLWLAGLALCGWGVIHEWRGPRRRSALTPGIAGIVFAWWLGLVAAEQTRLVYIPQSVSFQQDGASYEGTLYLPRAGRSTSGVVILPGRDALRPRAMRSLGRSLARNGVAALVYGRADLAGTPRPLDQRTRDELAQDAARATRFLAGRPRVDGNRVGLMAFGEQGWILPAAAARSPAVSFVVMASTPLPVPDSTAPPEVPTLVLYGTSDPVLSGTATAYQAAAWLGEDGHPDHRIRVFIRAGHLLEAPGDFGMWIQPRYARGMVDFVANWMSTRPPDPWNQVAAGSTQEPIQAP